MARPRLKIDREQVAGLAQIGCTVPEMAAFFKCSPDTLERRFAGDIERGRFTAKRSLRRKQWEVAQTGNTGMLIWLGKQMLGQSDKQELSGKLDIESKVLERLLAGRKRAFTQWVQPSLNRQNYS